MLWIVRRPRHLMRRPGANAALESQRRHLSCSSSCSGGSAADDEVVFLRREVAVLRREVAASATTIRHLIGHLEIGTTMSSDTRPVVAGERGGGLVTVRDGDELEQALRHASSARVVMMPGREYSLLPAPFTIKGAGRRVEIFGVPGAVLTASFKLSDGAALTLHDIDVISHSESLPVIDASNSTVTVTNSSLCNGRDGVYLSAGSHLHCTGCRLSRNSRGIFEGFRCGLHLAGNTFDDNLFHLVLLGRPQHKRVEELMRGPPSEGNAFVGERTRGDFAFQYNPVLDHYSEVFRAGVPVVLTEQHSTANLVDPTW
jgi:hypothetical protein